MPSGTSVDGKVNQDEEEGARNLVENVFKMTQIAENGESPGIDYQDDSNNKQGCCFCLKRLNFALIRLFYKFGYQVGKRPLYFIIAPLIISLILSTGLFFIKYVEDPIVLFVPFTAPFVKEQKIVDFYFPVNYSDNFNPIRFTHHHGYSRLIVSAKDKGSILRSSLWPEITRLDAEIRNITIHDNDGKELGYTDLCSKWNGECINNAVLNLNEIVEDIENGTTFINYPFMFVPFVIPQLLGGAAINKTTGKVDDAWAVLFAYFLQPDTKSKLELSLKWEQKLIDFLKNLNYEKIEVSFFASRSLADELKVKMDSSIPYIPLTGFIMITSCMILLWRSDCVRGKPLIGVIGIISASMASGASFGFLIYCGAIYTRLNVVALFLVLGIGVDDIFVAISAWQKTSLSDSVPKRLAQTYADAAVSVTITSLTNALSFAVGITTPALIVESFCLYSCVTIIFAYIWFVTFCGGFLALGGYMEEQGRHSLFIVKVKEAPQHLSKLKLKLYSLICASPSLGKNAEKKEVNHAHVVSIFFRDYVGSLLCNTKFKIVALISLVAYFVGAIYGLTILREGLYRHRMSRDDSYLSDFFMKDGIYFRHLPYAIQVVITGNVTYSDPETQKKLMDLEHKFENLSYASDPIYTQSWFRSFFRRLRRKKDWQAAITDEKSFIKILREEYLTGYTNPLSLDVVYNDDYSRIVASRMLLQTSRVEDIYDDVKMMEAYRQVGRDSEFFNVTCFHLLFGLFDQHAMMRPLALQSIMIAVVAVIVVALLFIPDVRGSIAISFSILSIATGVIGYMAFWNINLDHVSAGSIFMCIGFSVDFSAHITYTYLSSKATSSEGRIRDSVHSLALPIIQGGLTTVLCLVTFLLIPGYGYRTFFKTILLVTIFAAYHSIILIPLFLSQLEIISSYYKNKFHKPSTEKTPVTVLAIRNGSLKQLSNGHCKASPKPTITQNNNEDEKVDSKEGEINEKHSNGIIKNDCTTLDNEEIVKGKDNDAYIENETD